MSSRNRETTYAGVLGELGQFTAALAANAAELPHLEGTRAKIEAILAQAQEGTKRQAALVASKQDASKEIRRLVTEGQRLAAAARKLLQEQYGVRSEKLAEFGVQPFRGRTRRALPATPTTPTPPAVPTPGGNPHPVHRTPPFFVFLVMPFQAVVPFDEPSECSLARCPVRQADESSLARRSIRRGVGPFAGLPNLIWTVVRFDGALYCSPGGRRFAGAP